MRTQRRRPTDSIPCYSAQLFNRYGIVYDNRFLPPPDRKYTSYATFDRPLSGISFDNSRGQYSRTSRSRRITHVTDKIHLKAHRGVQQPWRPSSSGR